MSEASTNASGNSRGPLRELWTLFALGSIGTFDDSRLLEIFLERKGPESEDAFAAIVRRHGPMVLGVCRRMLDRPHDADDAFQATFLILARRAAAIGRREKLASWLHGVAVRAAKEIRRGEARRHRRESQAMETARVESVPDDDHAELIPLLDEELAQLPERYRLAILACEIEGKSRSEAARQLGIAEGTLSSRLARGRRMLRDRLAARGVSLGIIPLTDPWKMLATPHLPESLAISTARAAAGSLSNGAASAAVITITERVLKVMLLAKLKVGFVAVMTIGLGSILTMASYSVVLAAIGAAPNVVDPPPTVTEKPAAKVQDKPKAPHDPRYARARGVVVDESGKPVPGVKVMLIDFRESWPSGMTDAAGKFDFDSRLAKLDFQILLATTTDGSRQGIYHSFSSIETDISDPTLRIILKPIRKLIVRVTDRGKKPVERAAVEAFGHILYRIAEARTDTSGTALLQLPADAQIRLLTALKSKMGFDYELFWIHGEEQPFKALPNTVELVLDGARTVRVKAVDGTGAPIPGIGIYPWLFLKNGKGKPGKDNDANMSGSRAVQAKTDGQGIATFDWLPELKRDLTFWSIDPNCDLPRTILRMPSEAKTFQARARRVFEDIRDGISRQDDGVTITMRLRRSETIRGRVTRPNGRPAAGVLLAASGSAWKPDRVGCFPNSQAQTRTAEDGTYEMIALPDLAYAVAVTDDDLAASTRFDVVVRESKPATGVDFRLRRGTFIHGTLTQGPDHKPIARDNVWFIEERSMPEALLGHRNGPELRMSRSAWTDARGHYSIRVGPGTFRIGYSSRTVEKYDTITVTNEDVLEHDIHLP
jgi:RNA polymerase sigma factor (sigma-70 family)